MSEAQNKNKVISKKEIDKKKTKVNSYAKYSGIAIQMGVIIVVGTFGGLKIDRYLNLNFPFFTLSLSILSVGIAIYLAIKDIIKYNS